MLEAIKICENEYTRYKSSPPAYIPAATYYRTTRQLPEMLKKCVSAVAAVHVKTGKFCWLIPCESWVRQIMEKWQPAEVTYYGAADMDDMATVSELIKVFHLNEKIWGQLRRWQRRMLADVAVCVQRTGGYRRGHIAPLGAGKSLGGLCVGARTPGSAAVLAPLHLHGSWKREAAKWGLPCPLLSTYESCHKLPPVKTLILDEVLLAKNPLAQRTQKALELSAQADVVLGMTGTPSSTAPWDLRWLRAVRPGSVPLQETAWKFLFGLDTRLEEIEGTGQKTYVTTKWDKAALTAFTSPGMDVVDSREIAAELPPVSYQEIWVPQPKRFNLILRGAAADTKQRALSQARQISDGWILDQNQVPVPMGTDKLEALRGLIEQSDEPMVIYSAWDCVVQWLGEQFADEKPAVLRGATGNYDEEAGRFQDGQTRLLIANARISTGLNLQMCGDRPTRIMVFFSHSLSPVDLTQSIGRIVRPGGAGALGVQIIDIMATNSLDQPTLTLLRQHSQESEGIVTAALERIYDEMVAEKGVKNVA